MGSIVAEIADKIASAGGGERSELEVRGGIGAAGGGILTLSTSELTVVDGDILGRIDFQAPLETGTDAIVVSASIYAEADDAFAADNNSTELVFAVGASEAAAEKMRLTHDGELGIGIATPASKLHVEGTVQVGVNDAGFDFTLFGHAAGAALIWDASADALLVRGATADAVGSTGRIVLQTAQTDVRAADVLGRIDFQAPLDTQGTDGILVTASITGVAEETFTASVNGTALTFAVADGDAVVERMRITHDGFVGIGTTAPTGFLHIFANDTSHGVNAAADDFVIEGTGVIGMTFASDADMSIAFSDNDNSMNGRIMYDISAGDLTFWTNELQRVTIDDSGLVGIGTTAPGNKLTVKGDTSEINNVGSSAYGRFMATAGEGKAAHIRFAHDEEDDNGDIWMINNVSGSDAQDTHMYFVDYGQGSFDNQMAILNNGNVQCDGAFQGGGADYAEFFEWKEDLVDEAEVKSLYGMTVVLDGEKVRIAESGEEDSVLGVVRPNSTSAACGGGAPMRWEGKYSKDVWGETIQEEYTQCKWFEYDADGNETKKHSYMKDRIPAYVVKEEKELNNSEPGWHLLEANFILDGDGNKTALTVPSTSAQKTAANYKEWSVYKAGKKAAGQDMGGTPLLRNKVNSDYVSSNNYIPRELRRTEWCVVGLLGQIPINDTAVIPGHWIKMKNLKSGIDLYYIK